MSAGLACRRLAYAPGTGTTGQQPILSDLTIACAPGAVTLISGPTGAGKTTLLGLLAGLLRPTGGTVTAEGEPISRWAAPHRDRWRRQVGLAFQQPRLLPELTALENVMLPLIPRGLPPARIRRRSLAALTSMDTAALANQRAAALSGGEGQRVGLARALAVRPRYLLVDEPTSQQDAAGVARVLTVLADACQRGAVVVATSHDPRLLTAAAIDRHHRLVDGRLDTAP